MAESMLLKSWATPLVSWPTISRLWEKVLVVEDEPSVREVNARMLGEFGYTVLEASNGDEALQIVKDCPYEDIALILTDLVMPLMGGKELAERLASISPKTKDIFTSGYMDNVVDKNSQFLQKPITPAVLAHKLREVLGN